MQIFQPVNGADLTVGQVIGAYLPHCKRDSAARTYQDRSKILLDLKEDLGASKVGAAKPLHLSTWLYGHEQWRSDWTLRRVAATVQACFNWATKMGLLDRNPFKGVTHREGDPGEPMSDEHFRALLRHSTAVFRRVLIFQRYTGARPCEMSAAEWEYLDPERGVIVLHKHKTRRTQRQPKPRVIVLHPVVIKLLAWILEHAPHEKFVFVNHHGRPWTRYSLALRMNRLRAKAGVPKSVKLYGLRHSFGSRAVLNDVNIKVLSELMGHTAVRTTERYVHIAQKTERLVEAVEKAMGRACGF